MRMGWKRKDREAGLVFGVGLLTMADSGQDFRWEYCGRSGGNWTQVRGTRDGFAGVMGDAVGERWAITLVGASFQGMDSRRTEE